MSGYNNLLNFWRFLRELKFVWMVDKHLFTPPPSLDVPPTRQQEASDNKFTVHYYIFECLLCFCGSRTDRWAFPRACYALGLPITPRR